MSEWVSDLLPVLLNITWYCVHAGIESVYDEPMQASNTTIADNPSYGVNKRRNQGSELIYCLFHWTYDIVYIQVLNQCMMNQYEQVML